MSYTEQENVTENALWHSKRVHTVVVFALGMLAVLLLVQVLSGLKAYRYIGSGVEPSNVLVVSGEGEVFAVPDRAMFTASFEVEGETASGVQDELSGYVDALTATLKGEGVEESDIRTTGYNLQPKYVWVEEVCTPGTLCQRNNRVQDGFTATQEVEIKIKDIDTASSMLEKVAASEGVKGVSSVQFTIDDEDALAREARNKAIEDAKTQARELAKELGVGLVRIVRFTEDSGGYSIPMLARAEFDMAASGEVMQKNALPTGENRVGSSVQIVYEIR